MLNCHRATRLMSDAMDRPLTFREKVSLSVHLRICDGCRHFRHHMDVLRDAMRDFSKTDRNRNP